MSMIKNRLFILLIATQLLHATDNKMQTHVTQQWINALFKAKEYEEHGEYKKAVLIYNELSKVVTDNKPLLTRLIWQLIQCSTKEMKEYLAQHGDLKGKKVLVYAGWGLGDTIQYIRHLKILKSLDAE